MIVRAERLDGQKRLIRAMIQGMASFIAYLAAASTLCGCLVLPWVIFQGALVSTHLTFRRFITDRNARGTVQGTLTATVVAQVTFTSVATLAGTAAAAVWWMIPASHAPVNPITFVLTGGGVGLIASINLSVPVLGPWLLATKPPLGLPFDRLQFVDPQDRRWWQWLLHGPEEGRPIRWSILATTYLILLDYYAFVVFCTAWLFYAAGSIFYSHGHPHGLVFWLALVGGVLFLLSVLLGFSVLGALSGVAAGRSDRRGELPEFWRR